MDNEERATALEALSIGLELEKKGYKFYQEASVCTLNPKGKAMFIRLAQDEIEHEKKLLMEYNALMQTGDWLKHPEEPMAKIYKITEKPQVFTSEGEKDKGNGKETSDLDALRMAIENEKRAYEFFAQAAEKTTSPAGKKLFKLLAAEEDSHIVILEAEYDNLADTGFWFGYQEFTMEHA